MTKQKRIQNEIKRIIDESKIGQNKKVFQHYVLCYKTAEEAMLHLIDESEKENGPDFTITEGVLRRLLDDVPLTAITEKDFEGVKGEVLSNESDNYIKIVRECSRMPGLLQYTIARSHKDGSVSTEVIYSTSGRHITTEVFNGFWYFGGLGERLVEDRHPITLPYCPSLNKYQIRAAQWFDFDYYIDYITPEGNYYKLNKLIRRANKKEVKGLRKLFIVQKLKKELKRRKINIKI